MGYPRILGQMRRHLFKCAAIIAMKLLLAPTGAAQEKPAGQPPEVPLSQDLNKYPGLLAELGRLVGKFQSDLQFPSGRRDSRLLPLLPESTIAYAAFPNYGEAVNQALRIFRQELQENAALRDWWQHGEMATAGPKVEDSLDKVSQLFQYLGGEVVVSGAMQGREPRLLMVAEVRKLGLRNFLQQMLNELGGKSKPSVRVLDLKELAEAEDRHAGQEFVVLVRPDFVVGALDLATLRSFSARLDRGSRAFAATPFGKRVTEAYGGGVTVLGAVDLHTILSQAPASANQNTLAFQRSGFADLKYLVWEHKSVASQAVSRTELSFTGPRHGAASWLAGPAPLGSLDFVSPQAMLAGTLLLKNPAQIFEEAKEIASASNSNAFAAVALLEQALKISLKEDLLSHLGGEVTLELDNVAPPKPEWKAILRVSDPDRLQQTLSSLLAAANFAAGKVEEGGVTYYTARIPSPKTSNEIGYAFVDEYLVAGSSRDVVAEAVQLHRSGKSLGKSKKFLASLPPGHPSGASALFYENPIAMTAMRLGQMAPGMTGSLAQLAGEGPPAVACAYGEETAIHGESTSSTLDAGVILVGAAIAIPNLLRSRIAANEASAVGSVRTVNTAQITYAAGFPQRGYAPSLAALGPDPRRGNAGSPDHAGLLSEALANESCTGDAWCTKSGYRFRVKAICKKGPCVEYVVVATPVDNNSGTRSFCSTSDGVIRSKAGPPLAESLSVAECRTWAPLE